MRVIAGKFRGRPLVKFKAEHIRPTTDRVKESIFNKLQGDWDGARVLDLFSGTGNLSIEAVSRGAVEVVAVESNKKSLAILKQNVMHFDVADIVQIMPKDVFSFLQGYEGAPFDIVLVDPPFTLALADQALKAIGASAACGAQTTVVIEAAGKEHVAPSYIGLQPMDVRDYGDKKVYYWRGEEEGGG